MTPELSSLPALQRPYEVYGLDKQECSTWRVNQERFDEILADERTTIHTVRESSNAFGEFLFVSTSRPGIKDRVAITFFGLGYHEHRERWITNEWFWYQANVFHDMMDQQIDKEEAAELIRQHLENIRPYLQKDTQTRRGKLFETLADLTDDDGALAELGDMELSGDWPGLEEDDEPVPPPPPTGENLLDLESREKLPPLYSGEEKGLDALAQVKFFTPDSNWTWYASEFDGNDLLFGLVIGYEIELGYFSLAELKSVKGPLGLLIERDLYYRPRHYVN